MLLNKAQFSFRYVAVVWFACIFCCSADKVWADAGTSEVSNNNNISRGSLHGVLRPIEDIQQSSRAAGVIEKFGAEEGQQVNAGDVLVQLNSEVERATVKRAEAVWESTKNECDRTQRELDRVTKLYQDEKLPVGSKKDVEDAQGAYLAAVSRRKQAEAEVEIAKAQLNERMITAKISGILLRRTRSVGEAVERLEPVVRIVDVSKLSLTVYAGADLLGKFKKGQPVRLMVENGAGRGTPLPATVSQIDPVMDAETSTFRIKLEVQPGEMVQPGIPVMLEIPSEVNP
jgi:membrane fusion protein (multidrug efflux system)